MPEESGFELLRQLPSAAAALRGTPKVIVTTGFDPAFRNQMFEGAKALGAVAMVGKEKLRGKLLKAVSQALTAPDVP